MSVDLAAFFPPPDLTAATASAIAEAEGVGDFERALMYAGSENRFRVFLRFRPRLDTPTYWRLWRDVWSHSEINTGVGAWPIRHLWVAGEAADRERFVMNDHERAVLANLRSAELVTLFRGSRRMERGESIGWSWTPNRDLALWFAHRYNTPRSYLMTGLFPSESLIAFQAVRDEDEVIADPACAQRIRRKVSPGKAPRWTPMFPDPANA